MSIISRIAALLGAFAVPMVTLAVANTNDALGVADRVLGDAGSIIQAAIPIIFAGAILGFFYGLAQYVFSAGNEEAKEKGKLIMTWGLIALFVMASVFGIIRLFQTTLLPTGTAGTGTSIDIPKVKITP